VSKERGKKEEEKDEPVPSLAAVPGTLWSTREGLRTVREPSSLGSGGGRKEVVGLRSVEGGGRDPVAPFIRGRGTAM
jgi:hypothetical protein